MLTKLENLEKSNKSIESIAQGLNQTNETVENVTRRTDYHEQCLKVLAYKSIDLGARSRRNNLLFHGLVESPNENVHEKLGEFLWTEMGLDIDDFISRESTGWDHFTGQGRLVVRPTIVAFGQYRNTNTILETAYMLRGSEFSVSRDLPKEILNARKNLMPQYKQQKQIRGNEVTLDHEKSFITSELGLCDNLPSGGFSYASRNDIHSNIVYSIFRIHFINNL